MSSFDYVIVGAGSAGCVIAHRLALESDASICMIEAGPPDRDPFIHIPAGFTRTIANPKVNWMYKARAGAWCGERLIEQPRGKTLGGSGSINGHVFNRGQAADFDDWEQRGNRGWSYGGLLPYFKRLENRLGPGDEYYRGREGPLAVTDLDWQHPLLDSFTRAANGLGIPTNPDYNASRQSGVMRSQRTILNGRRVSPARAFLRPALKRGRIDLRTGTLVDQILFEGRRATGVSVIRDGRTEIILARREVILCAGVFNSPQILHRSGVGPGAWCQEIGVPVIADIPGVGINLRDHCYVGISARVRNVRSINERASGLPLLWEIAKYAIARRGILALQPSMIYVSWKSSAEIAHDDIQLAFAPGSYDTERLMKLESYPGMTCAAWQHRPASSGYARACSRDPAMAPEIDMNYLAEETDRRVLLAALRLARTVFQAPEMAQFYDTETFPGREVESDDEWYDVMRRKVETSYHPAGTCRMGPGNEPDTVVGADLKIHGLEGLRVADASIMPSMISANLNAATLMIGEKAADLIMGREPLPIEHHTDEFESPKESA